MVQVNSLIYKYLFGFLLTLHFVFLLLLANDFSISYKEAEIFFNESSLLLSTILNISTSLLGQNDIAIRLPFILFYMASSLLLYLLTQNYFKQKIDQLISIAVFMMLPGVNSAALLVNEAIIVVFFTLLYLYIYKMKGQECYLLAFLIYLY